MDDKNTPDLPESEREIGVLKEQLRRLEKERDDALARVREAEGWREAADLLRVVFDSSFDAIVIHTLDGKVLDANETFLRLHGISREEALRLTIADFVSPSMSMETATAIWKKVAEGEDQVFEWKGRRYKEGPEIDAEVFLRRMPMDGQDVILAHVRDITRYKQTETEIRESRERLRQAHDLLEGITEGTEDLIAAQDPGFHFILFNRAFREEFKRIFGTDIEVGSSMIEALAHLPEDRKKAMKLWGRALKGESFTAIQEMGDPGLERNVYEMRYSPLRGAEGNLIGAAHIVRNVTAKVQGIRKLQKKEEQFRAFFDNAAVGTVQMALDGSFLRVNDRFCQIVGYSREELLGRSVLEITHPEDRHHTREALREFGSGDISVYRIEKRYLRKDGHEIWVYLSAGLVHDAEGAPLHLINVVQDITERKRMEQDLLMAKQVAEDASLAKSQFLANRSHELRTPMTVIMGSLELLKKSWAAPEREHLLEMADTSADRLLELIDDLLDISRIEARQLKIEEQPFDLRSCIRQAMEMFASTARRRGLLLHWTVDPQLPEQVSGDPVRLEQVLINLVGNAVKFTRNGEVSVNVVRKAGELVFSVRDTGIGIPADKISDLFRLFTQVDSSLTRTYGGTGLGLAISKELVEMMGGTLEAESDVGKGSIFTFTIPLTEVEKGVEPAPAEATGDSCGPLQVLLAEDDPTVRDLVRMILDKRGLTVSTAANGREAVDLWKAGGVDLILMDLQMPEMNGLEATRQIRELENGQARRVCIFALTAHARPEDRQECLSAGMDGFLAKPIHVEELNRLIESRRCGVKSRSPGN
jgi:PAS domain S-box-containing protein